MSVPERDLDKKAPLGYQEWLKLIGKGSGKREEVAAWLATNLLTLLMPGPDAKDAAAKAKDDPKGAPDDFAVRSGDRETLKKTMRKAITVYNAEIDRKKDEAKAAGKDPDKVGEKIDLQEIEKEWKEGKFGPKSTAALKVVADYLAKGTVAHLKILDGYGLDIPPGCPLEPPLDKSGRHIGDELFRAKLQKDEINFDILKKAIEEGKLPDTDVIVQLAKADAFITESQERLKSAFIRTEAGKLLAEIKSFEKEDPETHQKVLLTGWYPKKELMVREPDETPEVRRQKDLELEKWIAATTTALEPFQKIRNYAQTIGFLHYISGRRTESDFERWVSELPTLQRVIARLNGLDDKDRIFPDDSIKPENFPGRIVRNPKTGLVEMALPDMPPNPERSKEYRAVVNKANAWLDNIGPDVDVVQQELALLVSTGAVYPEGHPQAGKPIVSADKMLMVSEEEYPEKTDAAGKPITYPSWQLDSQGRPIGGQQVPDFNFCKHGIEVKKEGDEYVIRPYKQYYWARDYAYNHWNVGGDNDVSIGPVKFNTGAMQPAGEKIYTRKDALRIKGNQFATCIENGRLEFVPGDKVEAWAAAAERGEDVSKYVALTIDLALLATSAYEARGAWLLRKGVFEGVEFATKEAAVQAGKRASWGLAGKASWHFLLASTGFGRQLLQNELGAGKTWDNIRSWAIILDMGYQAFTPQNATTVAGRLVYGSKGAELLKPAQMESMFAKTGNLADRLLLGTEKILSGKSAAELLGIKNIDKAPWLARVPMSFRHGVMPYADLYFIWDLNSKTGQTFIDALRKEDSLHVQDAKDSLILGGPQANYDHRSPFEYRITPEQIKESSQRVMTEYGRSLTAWSFDHDKTSFQLEKEIKEAKDQEKDKKKACVDHCLEAFVDPKSRAHKHVASAGLLELCPAEGEASKQVLGEIKGKKITRQDVIDYLENSAEGLNKKTAEILEAKLPEDDEKRSKHKQKLVEIFLSDADFLEKRAAAEGLFKLCAKDGKLEGALGEVEITTGLGKKRKVGVTGEEVTRYLNVTPEGLMREGRETLFAGEDDPRKKRHIADAVYAFKNGDDDATKTAAAIALLGNRKELKLDEVIGETRTYSVRLSFKKKEKKDENDTDEYSQVKVVKFTDKEAADKFEKELKEKYKDDPDALISTGIIWNRVTAKDALQFLKEKALSADTSRMRLVAGDYLCRLSHLAEDGFDTLAVKFVEAKKKSDEKPDDDDLKQDLAAKKKLVEEAKKFADLARFDYTDMVGACFEVLSTEYAPKQLKGEAIVGPAGPRLDFLLEYFKFRVEPGLNDPNNDKRVEQLAGLYRRDSKAIEAVLQDIAKDKNADPDLRALAVSVLSANTATRVTVNGQPLSFGSSVDIGSKTGPNVYIEAKGEGVAERHATITLSNNGTFSVAALGKNDVWIKRPGEKEPTYIKVGEDKTEIKPGDQVILGDKEKGAVLKFGTEREALLAQIHKEWSENADKPGTYAQLVRDRLKADLTLDTDSVSPLGGQDDLRMNKFRAVLALDQLQDLAGFPTDGDRTIALNKALTDCFDVSRPQLAMAVLEKLTEPMPGEENKTRLDTLTPAQLNRLRILCTAALTTRGLTGEVTDEMREKVDLKIAIAQNLPKIFKDADVGRLAEVVQRLQCFLSPDMKDDSNPYPSKFASLREAAIEPLAKLSPETARLVLPDVARNDQVETVRLKALEQLVEIGHPQLRELCIERLTTETDPLILKRLRRMEWFERRPDRASEEYQKEFRKASDDIKKAADRSLVGHEGRSKNMLPWSSEHAEISQWESRFFVKNGRHPSFEETGDYIKASGFKNYPYYEPYVKDCVYAVVSDGKGADETDGLGRRQRAQNAALDLRSMCQMLVAMKDERAKDMVWAMEACVLKGGTQPEIRGYALDGLEELARGGVISKEEFAVTVATLLENESRRIPKDKWEFKDAAALQLRLMTLLDKYRTPTVTPVLEALVDEEKYPIPEVREKAKALLFEMRERTGYFKELYVANDKATEADLAKPLKAALLKPNLDADGVCKALCLALNGRPITKADDERRSLAYMAGGDSHPKVRYLAAEFLMQSKLKEDRERGAEILAGILLRKPTEGTTKDAQALVDDIRANPKKYQEGDLALIDNASAAVKKEEAGRLLAALGTSVGPFGNVVGLRLVTPDSAPQRPDYSRDLDYQAAYERALTEIKRSWESNIPRFWQELDLRGHKYDALNPYTFMEEWKQAVRDRYDASLARRLEKSFHSKEKIKDEEDTAGQVIIDNMWKLYDDTLRKKALDKDGEFERTFLKFVIRRQGSPFMERFQDEAMDKAADTILQICQLKSPGAGDMEGFIAGVLIDDPTLPPSVRKKLLDAYLELVEPKGKISRERAAVTLAAVLKTEYQNTPKPDEPGYKESEERQLLILKQLHEWKTHMVSAVLEAIAKDHPIASVKAKAGEILKDFASKDVEDVLNFGRNMGSATLLADDPRLGPIVAAMNDEKRPIDQRFRAANLIMTNGADDVKAKHKTRALLVACDAAAKSESDQVRFDAARLLLSVPADDMKYTRSYAARALARLAITATPGYALESQALLKKMNEDERKIAVSELTSIIEKTKDKSQQANASILLLQLCPNESNVLNDYYKGKALTTLIDLALTGDEDLRTRLKGVLNDLPPKQSLIASNCALKWAEDHKDGNKAAIAEALMLSAAFFARADKETKSPAMMFDIVEKATKLLGKDDATTKELVALVSGVNKDSLLKPVVGAEFPEIISIWRALRSDNEETQLGAALTLVNKANKGVDDTYKFSAIDTLAELAQKGKSAEVRAIAEARLKEVISELEGPMVVDDRRKHWLYVENPTLKLAAAKTILFDTGSQVTAEDRAPAIIALTSAAMEGDQAIRKEAEKLLFKLKDEEMEKAVQWLGTMAFIAGRKETPDKERILNCWKLAERLYEKAGVDPNSDKFLRLTLERKRAEGKADPRELEELSDRIMDRYTERSKDPTAMYDEDRLDRYFKEYEAAKQKYGEGSLEVARAQLALAKVAYCRSFNSEKPTVRTNTGRMAEYHAKAAVEVLKKKLPADSVELCDALYRLGIAELKQSAIKPDWSEERDPKKQLNDAQSHLKEALEIYKKQKEKMPAIDGVWIASHLARAYLQGGKYEEAAEVNKDLVEFSKKKFGVSEASDVLRALTEVAAAYPIEFEEEKRTARAKEAEPVLRQALALSTASNGEEDNETIRLMTLLAKNLGEQKKDKEAVPYFETVIKHYKSQPKTDKEKLAEIVVDYGNSLFHLDKKKEAEAAFEEARNLRVAHEADLIHFRQDWFKRLLGDGEPTLLSKDDLEKVFKDKEAAFERLEAAEKKYGKDSVEAAKERLTISELFLKASQNTDHPTIFGNCARGAVYNGETALKTLEAKLGKDHPDLAMAYYQVAMAELWADKDEDAVGHLKQALAIATKYPDKVSSGDAVWIASRLVLANIKIGDVEGMDKALATLTELAGKKPSKSDRGDVSRALDQVVVAVSNSLNTNKKPRTKEAEQLLKPAIDISNKHNGADSVQTAMLTVRQAGLLAKRGDFEGAEPLYKKGIGVLVKEEDFPKEELADMLQLYSICLEQLKRPEAAEAQAARARELRKPPALVKP